MDKRVEKDKKSKFIKRCLVGYRHIDPVNSDMDTSNSLIKANKTVSFVFVKPGSIFDVDDDIDVL